MTSIEWLIDQLIKYELVPKGTNVDNVIFHQAKEIHMVETLLFAKKYNEYSSKGGIDTMEQYYQETFKKD
jgi:hypothetical protein